MDLKKKFIIKIALKKLEVAVEEIERMSINTCISCTDDFKGKFFQNYKG